MAKSRKNQSGREGEGKGARPTNAPSSTGVLDWLHDGGSPVALAAVLVFWLLYLAVFFAQPLPGLPENPATGAPFLRGEFQFLHVFAPENLVQAWFGGSIERFGLLDRGPAVFVAGFILTSSAAIGWLGLRWLGLLERLSRLEAFVFSLAVGLNAASVYTLAMGLLGGLGQWWLLAVPMLLAIFAAAALIALRRMRLSAPARREEIAKTAAGESQSDWGWFGRFGIWLIAPFALLMALGGVLPPWEFDVREYHLQSPKEWFQQGRIDFVEHNVYANMPLGAEMHALLAMTLMPGEHGWWHGALAGKLLMALFSLWTALALYCAGRRFVSQAAGAAAALVYISVPLIGQVSMQGLNEGALGFYLFTPLYAVLIWLQSAREQTAAEDAPDKPDSGISWLVLAGFLAGAAAACKYTGVVFVTFPLFVVVALAPLCRRWFDGADQQTVRQHGWNWRGAAIFVLAATAGGGLWYGKNWALAGNPTYPLAYDVFGGKSWDADVNQRWRAAHGPPANSQGVRYSLSDLRARLKKLALTNEWISPLIVPLAVLALLAWPERRLTWICLGAFAWFFLVWWLATHRSDRFWIPMLPVLALLAGIGATWRGDAWWRRMVYGLLAVGLFANLIVMSSRASGDTRFFVALDDLRLDLPREYDPYSHIHPAHRYLNSAVADGCRVLVVGDAQVFDIETELLYNTCFDDCILETLMKGRTPEERQAALRDNRISHVYIHWGEIDRYRSPGNYGYTDYVTRELVYGELVGGQGLLRLDRDAPQNPAIFEVFEVVGAEAGCGK